jgi:hypothetical protein
MLLAACGVVPAVSDTPTTSDTPPAAAIRPTATPLPPTSVTIVRFSAKDNRALPFQQTTQDATKVQQLYHSLDTLPYKVSSISGPLYAYGMGYELSFTHDSTLVLQVILQTCYGVRISNSSDCHQWTPALTTQIAATFDVPVSTLETKTLINSTGPNGPVRTARIDPANTYARTLFLNASAPPGCTRGVSYWRPMQPAASGATKPLPDIGRGQMQR